MPTKLYNTYAEAEEVRKRKQKQFPNFYVTIRRVKPSNSKRIKFYITVT